MEVEEGVVKADEGVVGAIVPIYALPWLCFLFAHSCSKKDSEMTGFRKGTILGFAVRCNSVPWFDGGGV